MVLWREESAIVGQAELVEQMKRWEGHTAIGPDGEKIGKIEDIYFDRESGEPEWALVQTGMFGKKDSFVPLAGAKAQGDALEVRYPKDQVKDAPNVEPGGELSHDEEARLYQHYRLDQGQESERQPSRGRKADDAMTRSEEELQVRKVRRPSELVRLKKYVVTENVQKTVPVQREEVRVEREPITDENVDAAMSGSDISEGEHEVMLTEEKAVADKRTVPKERVRTVKDERTDEETVSEELRKEQIETERKPRR
jgi:uncharacterized protein (TIGR02271 family)